MWDVIVLIPDHCLYIYFVLSLFPRDVLNEILDLIDLGSESLPTYSCDFTSFSKVLQLYQENGRMII